MIGWVVLDFRSLSAELDQATRLDGARGGRGRRAPMSAEAETAASSPRRRWLAYAPLVVFMALAWLLFQRLGAGDPASIPSVLIGHTAPPPAPCPGLERAPGLTDADLRGGHVSLVNVFGSWCEPCHYEHQYLMALAADPELKAKGVAIYGVAQKDSAENVRRFLGAKGDPYAKVVFSTKTIALASTGASTACPRRSSSRAMESWSSSSSGRSPPRPLVARSSLRSSRR